MTSDEIARYAPISYLDEREPFPRNRVSCAIITQTRKSPSFQRVIELEPSAIWSDWDIRENSRALHDSW